ncbi:MAG: transporter suffix domain-containing protein [Deltaproteobacteria bacterium]|nr:transporter suffix domain-containing protein [Deltaproteobacteria bacterium]MBW2400765.1 transporter suffix domain-containing protein [Deltaproteobacteria bacterium]
MLLLGLSVLLWAPIPVIPFLSISSASKAAVGGGLVVSAEIAFWLGAVLAGPEAANRMRSWFRRARKKNEEPTGVKDVSGLKR